MPNNRTLVKTGTVGAVITAICCVTPVVAIMLGAFGLSAWLGVADYVLFPLLFFFLAMFGVGLYRRRTEPQVRCDPGLAGKSQSSKL